MGGLIFAFLMMATLLSGFALAAAVMVRRELRACAATVSPRRATAAHWVVGTWPVWGIGVYFASWYALSAVSPRVASSQQSLDSFKQVVHMTALVASSLVVAAALWWATRSKWAACGPVVGGLLFCGLWLMAPTKAAVSSAPVEVVEYMGLVRGLFFLFAVCGWFACLKGGLWMWRSANWDVDGVVVERDRGAGGVPPPATPGSEE